MHQHGFYIFHDILTLFLRQVFPARLFQIRKHFVCLSGHADISCDGADHCCQQKQDKIAGDQQNRDLQQILYDQKPVMIQYRNVIHLMCVNQCFLVDQQIRHDRIQQIQQINPDQMIHIRAILHQDIQKRDQAQTGRQHKTGCDPVKGAEHPHQDLLLLNVSSRNRSIQRIRNGSSHAQLRQGKYI